MAPFRFRLERVLAWYRKQARIEEDRLRVLLVEYNGIDADKQRARDAREDAEREVAQSTTISAGDLAALSGLAEGTRRELAALDQKRAKLEAAVRTQQNQLNALRTRIRLIEKLRERRLGEHVAEEQKELEELAADAYRAATFRLGPQWVEADPSQA